MTDFTNYTNVLLSAYIKHGKKQEILDKKKEILNTVYEINNVCPKTCLCVGFSPFALALGLKNISTLGVSSEGAAYLQEQGINTTAIDGQLDKHKKAFDLVIISDEYFTFADSDNAQYQKMQDIAALANGLILTTLKDYKNLEYKEKEFSPPASVRNKSNITVYLEHHVSDFKDRNQWTTKVYELDETLIQHGSFSRRAMFFKQMAKYAKDAGANDFLVHKNIMYKSLIKKSYEHVITINFEEIYE